MVPVTNVPKQQVPSCVHSRNLSGTQYSIDTRLCNQSCPLLMHGSIPTVTTLPGQPPGQSQPLWPRSGNYTVKPPVSGHPRDQKKCLHKRGVRLWEVKNVVFVWGITKHRNGMECTRNDKEWYWNDPRIWMTRNVPEWPGIEPEWTITTKKHDGITQNGNKIYGMRL